MLKFSDRRALGAARSTGVDPHRGASLATGSQSGTGYRRLEDLGKLNITAVTDLGTKRGFPRVIGPETCKTCYHRDGSQRGTVAVSEPSAEMIISIIGGRALIGPIGAKAKTCSILPALLEAALTPRASYLVVGRNAEIGNEAAAHDCSSCTSTYFAPGRVQFCETDQPGSAERRRPWRRSKIVSIRSSLRSR